MSDQWDEWRQEAATGWDGRGPQADGFTDGMEPMKGEPVATGKAAKAAEVERVQGTVDDDLPPEVQAEERALVVQSPQHHLVTGMAALARMDEKDFRSMMAAIKTGQERMAEFQRQVMVKGEDYGTVKGIDRPFLHLPGAEKMGLLYGFAVRQEADRIVGDGVTAPPLAYHVRSYVHLGSFDGPVVGMGYGEASSWEVKYRYSWAKAKCPKCGREGLIRGNADGKLRGKWWCPSREGGCNSTFEPAATNPDGSLVVAPPGKVENTDPWSLAETLVQMAAKRSFVAAIRRATGTSGLFTQDDDSPSVRQQAESEADGGGDENPPVENVTGQQEVERGGKPVKPTPQQMSRLSALSKSKKLGPEGVARVITRVLDVPVLLPDEDAGRWLWGYIEQSLSADQLGAVLHAIETGEVPDAAAEAQAPTKAAN